VLVHAAGRTVLEVLQDFKSAQPPLEWLLQTVPHLKPRQFSIASSLTKHPSSAHLLMAVVDYKTPFKRRKQGLCSSWLASLTPVSNTRSAADLQSSVGSDSTGQHANGVQGPASIDASTPSGQAPDGNANGLAASNGGTGREHEAADGSAQGCVVPVWVERGVLRLPPSHSTPMILVGPGTGVAPFKSFLEERQMAAAGGPAYTTMHGCLGCSNRLLSSH